ncbi:MAG: HAMP domain-containing sensor histidine kinase [Vicingaceae bacterium]
MSLRLKAIILLMSAALLGLVFIQFYWIDSAISLKEDEFKQKVHLALQQVVKDLERKETVERFEQHQATRRLMHQKMLKHKQQLMQHKKEERALRRSQRINDIHSPAAENQKRMIIRERRSADSSTRIISREFSGQNYSGSSVQIDINMAASPGQNVMDQSDSMLDSKLNQRAEILDDIFSDMIQSDRFLSIDERINRETLDSMLKQRLGEMMINTQVLFGVFDYFGRMVNGLGTPSEMEILRASVYKARLFPNDFFGDPFFISLTFPNQKGYLLSTMWFTLSISTLFILLIIAAFSYTIYVIQNQKQLSLIKNDFINNMTHELKTPISTISLACEALSDERMTADEQKKNKFLTMISQENKRLGTLVENVLKSSIWDKEDFKLHAEDCDLHQILNDSVDSASIQVEKKTGSITTRLEAANFTIHGDHVHLSNVFNNLIDNAIKYGGNNPNIEINTRNHGSHLLISVKDNGVGISKDHQKKIFDKFYRVPKGNIHNVKGFGLGLNYVLNVVKGHKGTIEVKSTEGQGSTFTVSLPINTGPYERR